MKYIKHNGGSVTFKHLKSHQKPFMCKFVVLFVIYFSHVFPSIKFCLQVPNNLLSHTHTHTHTHTVTIKQFLVVTIKPRIKLVLQHSVAT